MNKIEKELLKRGKKILINFFLEELQKHKNQMDAKKDEEFLIDVFNSGILLDVNKLKKHGLNHLEKELEKRRNSATI